MDVSKILVDIKSEYDTLYSKMKEFESKGDKSSLEYRNLIQCLEVLRDLYAKLKSAKTEDEIRNLMSELIVTRKELKDSYNKLNEDKVTNQEQIYLVALKHNLMRKYINEIREVCDRKAESKTEEISKKDSKRVVADKAPVVKKTVDLVKKSDLMKELNETFVALRNEDADLMGKQGLENSKIRDAKHNKISRELVIIKSVYNALKTANTKEQYMNIVSSLTSARSTLDARISGYDTKNGTDLEAISEREELLSQKRLIRKYLDKVMRLYSLTPSAKHFTVIEDGKEIDYIPRNKRINYGGMQLDVDPDTAEDIFEYNFSCVSDMLECTKELLPLYEKARTMSKTDNVEEYDLVEETIDYYIKQRRKIMPELFFDYPNPPSYKHGKQLQFMDLLDSVERLESMYCASITPVHYEPYTVTKKDAVNKFVDLTMRISDLHAKGESSELFKEKYTPEEISAGATASKYIEELLHRRFDLYYSIVTPKEGESRTFNLFPDERAFNYNLTYEQWVEDAKKRGVTDLSRENYEDDMNFKDSKVIRVLEESIKSSETSTFDVKPIHSRSGKEELRKQLGEIYKKLCNLGGLAAVESFEGKLELQAVLYSTPSTVNQINDRGVRR